MRAKRPLFNASLSSERYSNPPEFSWKLKGCPGTSLVCATQDGCVTGFIDSSAMGRAAELKAAVILMERGHEVAVPLADHGVDLVVDYRWRVQVKSTLPKLRETNSRGNGYRYFQRHWGKIRPAGVDVFVLHSFEEGVDRWWVLPSSEVGPVESSGISCYAGSTRGLSARVHRFEDAWEFFGEPPEKGGGSEEFLDDLVLFS